jgi:alpha-D-ribose 1-methylphosphonate 5-triphosphate synthase subunit PhnH
MSGMLERAFDDAVGDSQRTFRAILDAMAHPGRVLPVTGIRPPAGLSAAAAATLLTLADHDTPLWLAPVHQAARPWIQFHAGAPIVTDPDRCVFALTTGAADLARFPAGTHEEPETSATLIVEIAEFGRGRRYRLSGPGLEDHAILTADGLGEDFATLWAANHALYPRGVDLILCAGAHLTALPRTVAMQEI